VGDDEEGGLLATEGERPAKTHRLDLTRGATNTRNVVPRICPIEAPLMDVM